METRRRYDELGDITPSQGLAEGTGAVQVGHVAAVAGTVPAAPRPRSALQFLAYISADYKNFSSKSYGKPELSEVKPYLNRLLELCPNSVQQKAKEELSQLLQKDLDKMSIFHALNGPVADCWGATTLEEFSNAMRQLRQHGADMSLVPEIDTYFRNNRGVIALAELKHNLREFRHLDYYTNAPDPQADPDGYEAYMNNFQADMKAIVEEYQSTAGEKAQPEIDDQMAALLLNRDITKARIRIEPADLKNKLRLLNEGHPAKFIELCTKSLDEATLAQIAESEGQGFDALSKVIYTAQWGQLAETIQLGLGRKIDTAFPTLIEQKAR